MINNELLTFVEQSRKNGMTNEQIRQSLLNSGWKESDINEALKSTPTFSVPRAQESQLEKNFLHRSREAIAISLILISTIGIAYVVSAKFLFNLWPFEKVGTSDQTNKSGSATDNFDKKPGSFYFMVSRGGTFGSSPTLSTIVLYNITSEQKTLEKENLPILTKPEENAIPHVAVSSDKKRLVFADTGLLLLEPSSGHNKHFFPQEEINSALKNGKINRMSLAAPVFSPDGEKVAYFGLFRDAQGRESKKQVRVINIVDGKEIILIDGINNKSGEQLWPNFAIYPVRWFRDVEGEKLLLERRETSGNARPLLTTGFLIYDFNKKMLSPVTFFIDKGKPIADCLPSDELPAGRLSAKCYSIPFYLGKSPDGKYMSLSWLDQSGYRKQFILDFSILENGGSPEAATINFQTCDNTAWSYEAEDFICSDFDFSKSIIGNSSAVLALEKSDSLIIPYVYRIGNMKTKTFSTLFQESIEYVVPADVKKKILEKLPKIKAELEKQLDKSKMNKDSPQYGQALDYNIGFSINTISTALKSKVKPVVGWISADRFITLQSSYKATEVYQEEPIKQTLFLSDLNGHEKVIGEYTADGNKQIRIDFLGEVTQ